MTHIQHEKLDELSVPNCVICWGEGFYFDDKDDRDPLKRCPCLRNPLMSTPVPPVQTVTPEQRNAYSRYLAAAEALDAAISDPAILEAADLDTKLGDAIDKAIDALHAPAAPLDP